MSFTLLPEAAENALHDRRLLNFEERPFKRLKNRLLGPSSPITEYLARSLNQSIPTSVAGQSGEYNGTASQDITPGAQQSSPDLQAYKKSLEAFKLHIHLDASSLKSHLARTQFLLQSNKLERERYSDQKESITSQCAAVRQRTADLRLHLEEARHTMEVRKGYDVLARAVMDDEKTRRSREELRRERERLRVEIDDLEREGDELRGAWLDRRMWLGRVMEEASGLRAVIRGETDADESGDGAEDEDGGDRRREEEREDDLLRARNENEGEGEGDGSSNVGTPRPGGDDGGATPIPSGEIISGGMTPRSHAGDDGGATPRPETSEGQVTGSGLKNEIEMGAEEGDGGSGNSEAKLQAPSGIPEVKVDGAPANTTGDVEMN